MKTTYEVHRSTSKAIPQSTRKIRWLGVALIPLLTCVALPSFAAKSNQPGYCKTINDRSGNSLPPGLQKLQQNCVSGKRVENLDRGLVVIPVNKGNAISWRLLQKDDASKGFHIYRNGKKITPQAIKSSTFFTDSDGKAWDTYQVMAVGEKLIPDATNSTAKAWSQPYLSIPLNKPAGDSILGVPYTYSANDATVADLDGDGQYEIIVKWDPSNAKDNSQSGHTGNVYIDAYTLEGQQLWRIDLGKNIRAGAHYTQFIAYDFDGDGRAEIAIKTADGTVDGRGNIIGNAQADHRNSAGYVLNGPEYLTMFDGLSGEALDTIDYIPPRGNVGSWGDTYGNRVDRFLAGVAYFDGESPSLFMARGYYTRAVVAAYDWVNGQFSQRWVFDTNNGNGDEIVFGQGAHSVSVADVDGDGRDEIIYGAAVIDDNGHALYSTGLGHGDALHVSDIDPQRPGLEVYMVHESAASYTQDGIEYGVELHDAATGEILWSRPSNGADVGRGLSADIDPRFPGNENWATRGGLVAANGEVISENRPSQTNFAIWWDGDLLRELLDGTTIFKWDYQNEQSVPILEGALFNAVSNNGTKATPSLSADIFGDWREEVIWANADSTELMIFSTTIPTNYAIPTLMQNPQYRVAIAWQNVGYNQPPHPDFNLGASANNIPDYGVHTLASEPWIKAIARGDHEKITVQLHVHQTAFKSAKVFRSTVNDSASKTLVATLQPGQHQWVDTNVVADVDYFYWVEIKPLRGNVNFDNSPSKTKLTVSNITQLNINILNNRVPVELAWRAANMDIRSITIYRQQVADANTPADFAASQVIATPTVNSLTWQDATATAGEKYYYWVAIDNAVINDVVISEPAYIATVLQPQTHLVSSRVPEGIHLSWKLEDFAQPIRVVEVYRNTRNQANGRTRVLASAPEEGELTDSNGLEPGTTYWYMFKLTMQDGSIVNTDPEASITY